MGVQSSILPEDQAHSLFLTLSIHSNQDVKAIISQCSPLPALLEDISTKFTLDVYGTLGLGYRVCQTIWGTHGIPSGMRNFKGVPDRVPATRGDLFFHITSNRADLNYEVITKLLNPLLGAYQIIDETIGTRYLESRDLTGFIDGTENPKGDDERSSVALIQDGVFQGGSFIFTQKYRHRLEIWNNLNTEEKENVIGRTMPDSIELDNKKENAHISRVVIEENGEELEVLRHSMPYLSVGKNKGLFFLAYTNNLNHIEKMLNRMYGFSPDGISDSLLKYTTPLTGAMFFAPSLETLYKLK